MAYTAWSVVFGEQPTAAKWNQLGTNDAGFKDGTNIDDDAIINRHIGNSAVQNLQLAQAAILLGHAESASGEAGTGVWGAYANVPTVECSVTTTKANQVVVVLCRLNGYQGGTTNYRFTVDGVAAGYPGKINWGATAAATTESRTFMDVLTIASAGAHTIRVQLQQGAATLRIINAEGRGEIAVITD